MSSVNLVSQIFIEVSTWASQVHEATVDYIPLDLEKLQPSTETWSSPVRVCLPTLTLERYRKTRISTKAITYVMLQKVRSLSS